MFISRNTVTNISIVFCFLITSATFATQTDIETKFTALKKIELSPNLTLLSSNFSDNEQTLLDFQAAQNACRDYIGGYLPDAVYLKKSIVEIGDRLRKGYYWSTTINSNCGAQECRIQIEAPTLTARSENTKNESGDIICITDN